MHERGQSTRWSPAAGPYYHAVHERARVFLSGSRREGAKSLERQLLDVRCYDVTHVARCLSDVALKEATGTPIGDRVAIFWTQLRVGGLRKTALWHPSATANLEEHDLALATALNPEPPRRARPAPEDDPAKKAESVPAIADVIRSSRETSPEDPLVRARRELGL